MGRSEGNAARRVAKRPQRLTGFLPLTGFLLVWICNVHCCEIPSFPAKCWSGRSGSLSVDSPTAETTIQYLDAWTAQKDQPRKTFEITAYPGNENKSFEKCKLLLHVRIFQRSATHSEW
jgi:hypothetical protein